MPLHSSDLASYSHHIPLASNSPALLYEILYQERARTFLFESGNPGTPDGKFSFLGTFSNLLLKSFGENLEIQHGGGREIRQENPLLYIQQLLGRYQERKMESGDSFQGGLVGYLGYDLVRFFESIPQSGKALLPMPDLYLGLTDELIVVDHVKKRLSVYISLEQGMTRIAAKKRAAEIESLCGKASQPQIAGVFRVTDLNRSLGPHEFTGMVEKAKEYIQAGDIFQANLSQRFDAHFQGDPWNFYRKLREINPSPFQGFINYGDLQIVSASPERLLRVDGGEIETRPIAGTRPRGQKDEDDKRLSRDLLVNEKERAEHLMLVDLERNDLGRVCDYGSVRVEEFMSLEAYSHVWHIVSKVTGQIKRGTNLIEILRACFPGGTITGCPKVRCMEIIEELEPVKRGFYTGSMGYLGWDGKIDLNILIRSAVITGGKIYFHAGAGIVSDSDPVSEYRETFDKAKAIFKVLGKIETFERWYHSV